MFSLDSLGSRYSESTNVLEVSHDWGLLSNASVTLNALMALHRRRRERPAEVRWERQSAWGGRGRQGNIFNLYFKPAEGSAGGLLSPEDAFFDLYVGDVSRFDFGLLSGFRDVYFRFSDEVAERERMLAAKYGLDLARTVAVLYRGTDKISDTPRVHPYVFAKELLSGGTLERGDRVLVQTDQEQVYSYMSRVLGSAGVESFRMEEMPLTAGDEVMHKVVDDGYELGLSYLASVSLISKARRVVMDTSNATIWVGVLRGNLRGACQILAEYRAIRS